MEFDLASHRSILVISPHLDDGVLSVGGLIERAARQGADVVVATALTADSPHATALSPLAVGLHALWDLGPNPYALRRTEDIAAVPMLGGRVIHGGLLDALYRRDAAGLPLYPTRESIFGPPAVGDTMEDAMLELFERWIGELSPDLVLAPLTIGRHVDHVIASGALRRLAAGKRLNVVLYEDMPYATGLFPEVGPDTVEAALARTRWRLAGPQIVPVEIAGKLRAIATYASQIADIFPNGIDVDSVIGQYMRRHAGAGGYVERLWPVA